MTEAAIIAAYMVIQFACMWGAVSYEKTKVMAMDEARYMSWQQALQPCDGSESTMGDIGNEAANAGSDPLPGGVPNSQMPNVGSTSLATDSGYVDLTRTQKVSFPAIIGGKEFAMQGKMYMRCNEPHPPENVVDFFKQAWNVIKGMFINI